MSEPRYTTIANDIIAKLVTDYASLEGCVTYARLNSTVSHTPGDYDTRPVKVSHSLFLLLAKGHLSIEYNMERLEIDAPAAISFPPGTLTRINSPSPTAVDAYLLDYDPTFLQEVNISFTAVSGEALLDHKGPVLALNDTELSVIHRYFSLIHTVLTDPFNARLCRHIVSSLTSALFYQCIFYLYKRIDTTAYEGLGPRRGNYVHDFIKLVHLYYTKERSVGFYASKLFISPKYLSLLVKESTGRSAAQWIDQFVIMEAKHLLRYSGKNIQQVAYDLNFSNQSSFGKYFKHLTGMSPTEFQKS